MFISALPAKIRLFNLHLVSNKKKHVTKFDRSFLIFKHDEKLIRFEIR